MLTGKIYLITEKKVISTASFSGATAPDQRGNVILSYLSQIYSEYQFKEYANRFMSRYYYEAKINIQPFERNNSLLNNLNKNKSSSELDTDWTYWRNLSKSPINFIARDNRSITLQVNENIALGAGKAVIFPNKKPVQSKDTIVRIVLIEKYIK